MKKILPLLLVSSLIVVNWTYADDDNLWTTDGNSNTNQVYTDSEVENETEYEDGYEYEETNTVDSTNAKPMMNNERWEKAKELKEELRKKKEEEMKMIKENRENMSQNRQDYRVENKEQLKETFSWMKEEKKDELKSLSEENRDEIKALNEEYKWKLLDEASREEYNQKLKELVEKHFEEMKTVVWDDETIDSLMQERKQVFDENKKLREENMNARIEYRWERANMIEKYKKNFVKRLEAAIPKIKLEKLSTVADKIDTMILNIEDNDKLSDDKKDSLVSQLVALKEIVEEEIENRWMMEDMIDIDAILAD